MRVGFVVGVALLALACVGVVAANEPPLADAGLDQDGAVNATVYLDAGGSLDSDGSIVGYEWSIESPDGTALSPDCPTCSQTWFVPTRTGRYNVTVSVADDAGARVEDTLYVQVGRATGTSPPPSTPAAAPQPLTQTATPQSIFMPGIGGYSGSGGGGGSGSLATRSNAMIVREGGNLYLAGSENMETLVVEGPGGENIEVSGQKFKNAQTSSG